MNTWDPIAYLKSRHTKQLLAIRDAIYRVNSGGFYLRQAKGTDRETYEEEYCGYNVLDHSGWVSMAQVKAELATREHIPNKKEAKVIRQEKAKHGN